VSRARIINYLQLENLDDKDSETLIQKVLDVCCFFSFSLPFGYWSIVACAVNEGSRELEVRPPYTYLFVHLHLISKFEIEISQLGVLNHNKKLRIC
jgi:hypothetical protein